AVISARRHLARPRARARLAGRLRKRRRARVSRVAGRSRGSEARRAGREPRVRDRARTSGWTDGAPADMAARFRWGRDGRRARRAGGGGPGAGSALHGDARVADRAGPRALAVAPAGVHTRAAPGTETGETARTSRPACTRHRPRRPPARALRLAQSAQDVTRARSVVFAQAAAAPLRSCDRRAWRGLAPD